MNLCAAVHIYTSRAVWTRQPCIKPAGHGSDPKQPGLSMRQEQLGWSIMCQAHQSPGGGPPASLACPLYTGFITAHTL